MRNQESATRSFDGTGDLVVVAPLREGFIEAFETVTYETRARMAAEALHNIRMNAREYEAMLPYSDTTERILNVLDFRLGVIDKNLFELDRNQALRARRYLFLCVTFDSGWEPYMRLIWRPLGAFLDLFFCNCEGYRPSLDYGFEDYIEWVRAAQVESSIFYSATGLSVADQLYFKAADALYTDPAVADRETAIARLTVKPPMESAAALRDQFPLKSTMVGLEALNVLYKLTDLYPADRLNPQEDPLDLNDRAAGNVSHAEGRFLLAATQTLLDGFDRQNPAEGEAPGIFQKLKAMHPQMGQGLEDAFAEPLSWFRANAGLAATLTPKPPEPQLDAREVQSGIMGPFAVAGGAANIGALLLVTIKDAEQARRFIADLPIDYGRNADDAGPLPEVSHTIAFTAHGLKHLGMRQAILDRFPREFRDGMEMRSGIVGDMRENHPRNWILPDRYQLPQKTAHAALPRVATSEIDFVIQLRAHSAEAAEDTRLQDAIDQIVRAQNSGISVAAVEHMARAKPPQGGSEQASTDHFGFHDGISQPDARADAPATEAQRTGADRDAVRLGELLCGYSNDRGDGPSSRFLRHDYLFNSTFLIVRKIAQRADVFAAWAETTCAALNTEHGLAGGPDALTPDRLKAYLLGREVDGRPLVPAGEGYNDFDYAGDPHGEACPLASHVRRTNPRVGSFGRAAPRILRRGMSFGPPVQDGAPDGQLRGIMFMAYAASISEQYETVQRWVNGGNATGIASTHRDPLLGVAPPQGDGHFLFHHAGRVMRCSVPATRMPDPLLRNLAGTGSDAAAKGQDGFTRLHWGSYLWVPSRSTLAKICTFEGRRTALDEPHEKTGQAVLRRLAALPEGLRAIEWKRLLENFDTKDPTERYLSPDVWSAIRLYHGGAIRIDRGSGVPALVLVANDGLANQVLSRPHIYSSCVQTARMRDNFGLNYVTMDGGSAYLAESGVTNAIMYAQTCEDGYAVGFAAATAVLGALQQRARDAGLLQIRFDMRRQFLMPTLGLMCREWFGIPNDTPGNSPDNTHMTLGGLNWKLDRKACCPGDFISASRYIFNPEPSPTLERYGRDHGRKIRKAGLDFVAHYRGRDDVPGSLAKLMFAAIADDDLLARNLTGMMLGMLAPIEANLRGIFLEWLSERTLWTHQAALIRGCGRATTPEYETASAILGLPIREAMCKRPAPDVLYRMAVRDDDLRLSARRGDLSRVEVAQGDLVIVGSVSVSQRTLMDDREDQADHAPSPYANVAPAYADDTIVFGGLRQGKEGACPYAGGHGQSWPSADQPKDLPTHACPARKMMTGSITGIVAALLNAGEIQAMPAGLVIGLSSAAK